MYILKVTQRNTALITKLCTVWEQAVRSSHFFLSESEVQKIAGFIPSYLYSVSHLYILCPEKTGENPVGFMGISGISIEMLFIAPSAQGRGWGQKCIEYALEHYSVQEVTVNEQNPRARQFYERMGFSVYKRVEEDEFGSYPILFMRQEKE